MSFCVSQKVTKWGGTRDPTLCKSKPKKSLVVVGGAGSTTSPKSLTKASETLKNGAFNVRGCSSSESKRMEIGDMFERRRMDILALNETKLEGRGEVMFGCVKGRKSGVLGGRAREGVVLLVSEKVNKWVVEWKEVSSRIMWVKMKVGCEVWVFVSRNKRNKRGEERRVLGRSE